MSVSSRSSTSVYFLVVGGSSLTDEARLLFIALLGSICTYSAASLILSSRVSFYSNVDCYCCCGFSSVETARLFLVARLEL